MEPCPDTKETLIALEKRAAELGRALDKLIEDHDPPEWLSAPDRDILLAAGRKLDADRLRAKILYLETFLALFGRLMKP